MSTLLSNLSPASSPRKRGSISRSDLDSRSGFPWKVVQRKPESSLLGRFRRNDKVHVYHGMSTIVKRLILTIFTGFLWLALSDQVWANNLRITNVTLEDRDPDATLAVVQFNISWDNSWRDTINHDAVWVVLKVKIGSNAYWCHAPMARAGLNPAGTSTGSNSDLEIYIPSSDNVGAIIRRKSTGSGTVSSQKVRLPFTWKVSGTLNANPSNGGNNCSISSTSTIQVKVVGVEMVFIPTAAFDAGSASAALTETASFYWFSAITRPWHISSEGTIITSTHQSLPFYYTGVTTTTPGSAEHATGEVFTLPPAFPKGYGAFYAMKYEISEGLYTDFMMSLTTAQKLTHDITTGGIGKNTCSTANRNTVDSTAGSPATCGGYTFSSTRPDRAMGYLQWVTFAAIIDWLGLRPMTELEYEKMARGPTSPVPGEFAWGSSTLPPGAQSFAISPEDGTETFSAGSSGTPYIVLGNVTFTQGDAYLGTSSNVGPARAGAFATSSSTRTTSGAGYYGNMELSGNLWEYVVSVGASFPSVLGLASTTAYTGEHGDGDITTGGYAKLQSGAGAWPGEVTTSIVLYGSFSGMRGGSWFAGTTDRARISDRYYAGVGTNQATKDFGGRGVRTYDGTDF